MGLCQLTVGDPHRAERVAKFLDATPNGGELFKLRSERGFLTITGTYKGTPISIVAIGMGIGAYYASRDDVAPKIFCFAPVKLAWTSSSGNVGNLLLVTWPLFGEAMLQLCCQHR